MLVSRPDVASDRDIILCLLIRYVCFALPLMQSAFLEFLDDPLLLHRFGPFEAPFFEVTCCNCKRLMDEPYAALSALECTFRLSEFRPAVAVCR